MPSEKTIMTNSANTIRVAATDIKPKARGTKTMATVSTGIP